jgi:hypothetical protein
MATLLELQTHYSAQDAYNLLEVLAVNNYNDSLQKDE